MKPPAKEKLYADIREALTGRYQNRLDQKLARVLPLNLRLVPTDVGTSQFTADSFKDFPDESLFYDMDKIFELANGRLLIVGEPGVGKTYLMLKLVLALLEKEKEKIPVILNLAKWDQERFSSLNEWMIEILPSEMMLAMSKKQVAKLVKANKFIVLFDGFDEIKEADRSSFLLALGSYGENDDVKYVVSSRIEGCQC